MRTGPHRIYPVTRICKVIVSRKGVVYLDWLGCWSAGLVTYAAAAW